MMTTLVWMIYVSSVLTVHESINFSSTWC